MLNIRTTMLNVIFIIIIISTVNCENVNNTTEVKNKTQVPCSSLAQCMHLGILKGLNDIERCDVYPLLGKRLVLEKTGPSQEDGTKSGIIQRTSRLLDNHVVRARVSSDVSLTLFRTPRGNFDLALEFGETSTRGNGRTFFKRRLQMALLPIMYKLGVLTTLIGGLVVMVAKGLVIGVILLMFAIAGAVKSKLLWSHHQEPHWSSGSGIPYAHHPPPQDIHVHVHGIHKEPILHSKEYTVPSASAHLTAGGNDAYYGPYNRAAYGVAS